MTKAYPTFIYEDNSDDVHPFLVGVPDLDVITEGDSIEDAIAMARDIIGLTVIGMEDDNKEIPEPSSPEEAYEKAAADTEIIDFTKGFLTYVDVDFTAYRKQLDNRMVRRNVTLPAWLNYKAEQANLNVSKFLQDALKEKLC